MSINKADLSIGLGVHAAFARSYEIKIDVLDRDQWRVTLQGVRKKQKKSNDQRAPVTRNYLIKVPGH